MGIATELVVSTCEQLRELCCAPHQLVVDKERPIIDAATREFIERSPFVLVGTVGGDGSADVSPRGGPSGFVQVLDETHIAISDLSGNNRLDTLDNIVANGQVGLLFVMPGQGETVRLNGTAVVTTDVPDAADVLVAQALLPVEATAAIIRDDLAKGYEHDLTEEMA